MYSETWRAVKYLVSRGCCFAPCEDGSAPEKYLVAGADDRARRHVMRAYPGAVIEYTNDARDVARLRLERDIAFAFAVAGLDQSPAARIAADIL